MSDNERENEKDLVTPDKNINKFEFRNTAIFPNQTLEDIISAFNQVSKVLHFENTENQSQMIVYQLNVNHIDGAEVTLMEYCRNNKDAYSGFDIEPADIDAKYVIRLNKDFTKRLVIFVYKFRGDKADNENKTHIIKSQRIFETDKDSTYVFLPVSFIDWDSKAEDRYKAYAMAYRGIFYEPDESNLVHTYKNILSYTFASVTVPMTEKYELLNKCRERFIKFIDVDGMSGSVMISASPSVAAIDSMNTFMRETYADVATDCFDTHIYIDY